jgi:uncharacterized damage-inducible protein DinB
MKEHLLHFLKYNDWANRELLAAILQLPAGEEAVTMFSHMIHAQDKWYNRLKPATGDEKYQWHGAPFDKHELEKEWTRSIGQWLSFLEKCSDEELKKDIIFTVPDTGQSRVVTIKDVIFQINCHCVHHRAQINKMISAQGMKVPPTDYILTALKDVE